MHNSHVRQVYCSQRSCSGVILLPVYLLFVLHISVFYKQFHVTDRVAHLILEQLEYTFLHVS